ncbi:MAG TPA: DUF3800 domain-containing protein [Thermoanaerobaculia bacterium]
MLFYFDESGDFAVPRDRNDHRAGVVVGLAIPDHIAPLLERKFRDFASTLEQDERVNGEPKGSPLCYRHRKAFAELMRRFEGRIALMPATLLLSDLVADHAAPAGKMANALREIAPGMAAASLTERLQLAASQVGNLSDSQTLRLYTLANALREVLAASIQFLVFGEDDASWEHVSFEIDSPTRQPNSREHQIFETIVGGWLYAWSEKFPLQLSPLHTPQLTVIRKYADHQGFNLNKLLAGNIKWRNSADSWGIQIADMAAATIGKALAHSDDQREVRIYEKLMRVSFHPYSRGPGLIVLNVDNPMIEERYGPLAAAVRTYQEGRLAQALRFTGLVH